MRRASAIILAALGLSGCQSPEEGAREALSNAISCPLDRVEGRDRPDLKLSSFEPEADKPPPAVAADPQRLALWQAKQDKSRSLADGVDDIEEARGCGKQAFYRCRHPRNHIFRAACSPVVQVPPGISHW